MLVLYTNKSSIFVLFIDKPDHDVKVDMVALISASEEGVPSKNTIISSANARWETSESVAFG